MKKTLYTGKTLFTADASAAVVQDFALLVEGEHIAYVGPAAGASGFDCDERVDFGDAFVLPGLIDAHVHLVPSELYDAEGRSPGVREARIVCHGVSNAKALLDAGVVACRDLGSVGGYALGIRDAIDAGVLPGPKILTCGYAICATGGHGYTISYEADGPDAVTRSVRQVVKDGGDVVKLMVSGGVNSPGPEPAPSEFTEAEIRAGIEAAHALGRKVAVHTHGNTAIRRCLEAGVDSVEHGVFMTPDLMEQMLKQGTFLVPTLSAPYYAVAEGLRRDPGNADHKKSGEVIARHRGVLRRCAELGVKIAMGTDAGCPFNPFAEVTFEMVLMVEAGLKPEQALLAATRGGAELLGLDRELGSLEAGKKASFIVLLRSPLEDIRAVTEDRMVYQNGKKIR